jgi:hypothetical protein
LLLLSGATVLLGGLTVAEHRDDRPLLGRRGAVAALAACGVLPALWQLLLGLSRNPGLIPGGMFLGLPLVIGLVGCGAWSAWRWWQGLLPGPGSPPRESSPRPAAASIRWSAAAPPIAVLLVLGVFPTLPLSHMEPLAARYLRVELPAVPEIVPPPARVFEPLNREPSPSP